MGLDDALIFTRVVEYHSFTQAAQSLGMQKSTVSRRIALLEERLGVRLLNRTTRKLRLTEVGQAYYERCRQIMHDFAEADQGVKRSQQAPSGLVPGTSPEGFGQRFLAP
ncbi:LysR family transcriptional regulator, partial [Pseudomonas aeruginosa]|uniref:LysR family transcriptional regulator n=1 Tax=Pseudomonas aeruginosa TaxID=287 RepID=UPI0039823855